MNHIVLFEPEIPQNTGNIMRTCVATNTRLHLIKPFGFSLTNKQMKRSGLDYIADLDLRVYEDIEQFYRDTKGHYYYFTKHFGDSLSSKEFPSDADDIYLVFGSETVGLPKPLLHQNKTHCLTIPMATSARSLNLSNAVAIGIYEVLRQQRYAPMHVTTKK